MKTTDNQPTITTCNSQATFDQIKSTVTTIVDDQSSSLIMMPIASAPTISPPSDTIEQRPSINPTSLHIEQQQFLPSSDILTSPKTNFDIFTDQQLQATLEQRLRNHLLSSTNTMNENIQQQRKTRLTKSETGKLIDDLDFTKQVCNLEHYEKQVRSNLY